MGLGLVHTVAVLGIDLLLVSAGIGLTIEWVEPDESL